MGCPFRKEVVMVFCDASPVKKLVPADRIVPMGPCACGQHEACAIYQEAMTRLHEAACGECPAMKLQKEKDKKEGSS